MRAEASAPLLARTLAAMLLWAPAAAVAEPDPLRTAAALRDALTQFRDTAALETQLGEAAAWFDDVLVQGSDPGEAAMNARAVLPGIRAGIADLAARADAYDTAAAAAPPLYPLTAQTVRRGLKRDPRYLARMADLLETHAELAADAAMLAASRGAWAGSVVLRQTDWGLLIRAERDALPADHPEHLLQVHGVELADLHAAILAAWTAPSTEAALAALPRVEAALLRYERRAVPALDAALAALPAYEAALRATLATLPGGGAGPRAAAAAAAYTEVVEALRETSEISAAFVPLVVRGVLDPTDPALARDIDALYARSAANHRAVMDRWIAIYDAILTPPPASEEARP